MLYEDKLTSFSIFHMFSLIIIYNLFEIIADINCLTWAIMFLKWLQMFQYLAEIAVLTVNACVI